MFQSDGGRERVAEIALSDGPAVVGGPEEAGFVAAGEVAKDAEAAGACPGVIFLADVGEEDVADLVLAIEGDQEAAVADGDVTGHAILSKSYGKRRAHEVRCTAHVGL